MPRRADAALFAGIAVLAVLSLLFAFWPSTRGGAGLREHGRIIVEAPSAHESCKPVEGRINAFTWRRLANSFEIGAHMLNGKDSVMKDPYRNGDRTLKSGAVMYWNTTLSADPPGDALAVAAMFAFMPHLGPCIDFPFPVSTGLQDLLAKFNVAGTAGLPAGTKMRIGPIDPSLRLMKPDETFGSPGNTKSVLVWGGGLDSSGVGVLLHDAVLVHEQYLGKTDSLDPFDDSGSEKTGRALVGWRARGRDVRVVTTNCRDLYEGKKNWGMPWWGTVVAGSGILAAAEDLKSISSGSILASRFLHNGGGFTGCGSGGCKDDNDFTALLKVGMAEVLWNAAGLYYNQPLAVIGEFAGPRLLALEYKRTGANTLMDVGYCDKHHGEHCNKCDKCARKEMVLLTAMWKYAGTEPQEAIKMFPNAPQEPYQTRYRSHYNWDPKNKNPPSVHPGCDYIHGTRSMCAHTLLELLDTSGQQDNPHIPTREQLELKKFPKIEEQPFNEHVSETLLNMLNKPAPFATYLKDRFAEYGIHVIPAGTKEDKACLRALQNWSYSTLVKNALADGVLHESDLRPDPNFDAGDGKTTQCPDSHVLKGIKELSGL